MFIFYLLSFQEMDKVTIQNGSTHNNLHWSVLYCFFFLQFENNLPMPMISYSIIPTLDQKFCFLRDQLAPKFTTTYILLSQGSHSNLGTTTFFLPFFWCSRAKTTSGVQSPKLNIFLKNFFSLNRHTRACMGKWAGKFIPPTNIDTGFDCVSFN